MPSIEVTPEAYSRASRYAAVLGITTDEAVSKMVIAWMNDTGDMVLSFLDRKDKARKETGTSAQVIKMPERATSTKRTTSK